MAKNKKGSKAMRSKRENYQRKKPLDGTAWTANILKELEKAKDNKTNSEMGDD